MEQWRSLPARERALPGESLASLLRRTAAAMGYDNANLITRLLGETYKPHQNLNWMGPGPHLDRLAILLHRSAEDLLQRTVHRFAAALVLRPDGSPTPSLCENKTALRFFAARTAAVCPTCLAEDATPYERLLWAFRPLQVCTRHACSLLARCSACTRLLLFGRRDLTRCPCGTALAQSVSVSVSPATLGCAQAMETWLRQDADVVPQLPSAAGFWLAERLARAVSKTPGWIRRAAERFDLDPAASPDLLHWTAAVEIVRSWPECLYQFLDEFQRVAKNQVLSTGVSRSFGLLLREGTLLEGLGYAAPAQALRQYLLERYTGGHINRKVGLFQSREAQRLFGERPWCTQTEAAKVLRLRRDTVADLVRRGLLEGQIHQAGDRGRSIGVVSRTSVEALRQALSVGLNVVQTRRRLRVGRPQVFDLIRAGLLEAVRTCRGWVVLPESVRAVEAVCQDQPRLGPDRRCWLSLREATRVYGPSGLNLARALELVRAGQVAARTDGRHRDLQSLWLWRPDLEAQVPALRTRQCQEHGYPLWQLGKVLLPNYVCREPVLKKWIRMGLLRARKPSRAWVVTPEEVERFRREFCLAGEACSVLRVGRKTLYRWEVSGRLTPVYGKRATPGAGFSLYRRADLLALEGSGRRSARRREVG